MTSDKNIKDRERFLREVILYFRQNNLSFADFQKHLEEAYEFRPAEKPGVQPELLIPVSVFDNNYLSSLEAVIKYLHENKELRFAEIARLVKRDQRAIGVTYRFASKKMKVMLKAPVSKYELPVSVLAQKKLSVLESIVYYIKKNYDLSYHDVARLLRRDDRTVWTVYYRALRKLKK